MNDTKCGLNQFQLVLTILRKRGVQEFQGTAPGGVLVLVAESFPFTKRDRQTLLSVGAWTEAGFWKVRV